MKMFELVRDNSSQLSNAYRLMEKLEADLQGKLVRVLTQTVLATATPTILAELDEYIQKTQAELEQLEADVAQIDTRITDNLTAIAKLKIRHTEMTSRKVRGNEREDVQKINREISDLESHIRLDREFWPSAKKKANVKSRELESLEQIQRVFVSVPPPDSDLLVFLAQALAEAVKNSQVAVNECSSVADNGQIR